MVTVSFKKYSWSQDCQTSLQSWDWVHNDATASLNLLDKKMVLLFGREVAVKAS